MPASGCTSAARHSLYCSQKQRNNSPRAAALHKCMGSPRLSLGAGSSLRLTMINRHYGQHLWSPKKATASQDDSSQLLRQFIMMTVHHF